MAMEGYSQGGRDAPRDRGMLLGMAAHGKESGALRQLEILPAWSEDNEPGLAKLLTGVNTLWDQTGRVTGGCYGRSHGVLILCKVLSTGSVPHHPSGGCCSGQFGRTHRSFSTQSPEQKPLCHPQKGRARWKCEVPSRQG